jgi:hypothetical protein
VSRFLITGLPRSRTAWLAVATGALHEPISRDGWALFCRRWADGTGVSDSGAAFHLPQIAAAYAPQVLIVERPYDDVVASLHRFCWGRVALDWAALAPRLAEAEAMLAGHHGKTLRVAYEALNDIGVLRECFAHLGVPEPANLEQLMHMNIQSDLHWNVAQLGKAA